MEEHRVTDSHLATIDVAIVGIGKLLWRPQLLPSPRTVTAESKGHFGLAHSFLDVLLSASEKLMSSQVFVSITRCAINCTNGYSV
jgi:hypothetical protein